MRRTITIASCLLNVVLCFAALFGWWLYLNRSGQGDGPAPEANRSNDQANNKPPTPTEKPPIIASAFDLPVHMVSFGDDQFSPCYLDLPNKVLYRWDDVVLRKDQLPAAYTGPISRIRMVDAKDFPEVVTIRPLVKYREVNGKYRPGWLFRPCQVFFEWKGFELEAIWKEYQQIRLLS